MKYFSQTGQEEKEITENTVVYLAKQQDETYLLQAVEKSEIDRLAKDPMTGALVGCVIPKERFAELQYRIFESGVLRQSAFRASELSNAGIDVGSLQTINFNPRVSDEINRQYAEHMLCMV